MARSSPRPREGGGVAWLELADVALQRLAALHRAAATSPTSQPGGPPAPASSDRPATTLAEVRAELDPVLAAARQRFATALTGDGDFAALAANAALTPSEAELLAVAAAIELHPDRQRVVAWAQDDPGATRLVLHTIGRLFGPDHPGPRVLGPESGLRRSALVDVVDEGPWGQHPVVVAPAVVWALAGDLAPDPDLPTGAARTAGDDPRGEGFVVVSGPDRVRRRALAIARTAGASFLVTPVPEDERGWRAIVREATVGGAGVILELDDGLPAPARPWIERTPHLAWALSSRRELPLAQLPARPWTELRVDDATATEAEWKEAFGRALPADITRAHRLSAEQVTLVGRAAAGLGGDVDAAVRRLMSGPLEHLARRVRPSRTWDDIVLVPERLAQLHELAARYRHAATVYDEWGFRAVPSRGVVALFSGPSGTGKTLAAEIVAGALGLDLFKLDLSSVVSKYIGETEKNLEQVFEAASAGNVVLFFDEADALFGKRSEVTDARDRYANIEVSYLLQRLETHDGVVVLATNFEKNIDEAFLRRIQVRIEFSLPEEPERRAIWQHNLPAAAPLADDVDLDFLARQFPLTGGAIRNAALQGAFIAAAEGTPITMASLVRGVGREYQKLGRLRKAGDFGPYHAVVARRDDA